MADTNKTEPGTSKRKEETRERGEVARSQELSASVGLLAGFSGLAIMALFLFHLSTQFMAQTFRTFPQDALSVAAFIKILRAAGGQALLILSPLLLISLVVSVLVNYLQVGFRITPAAIIPKMDKLNPLNGFKRMFSMRGWVETLKAVIKLTVCSFIVWDVLKTDLPPMFQMSGAPLWANLALAGKLFWAVVGKVGFFFLCLGVADLIWQRFEFGRKLKMTKQEVKDEMRQTEGDPLIRMRVRSKHRKLVTSRMAAEVARADVVTTNPTHYAVALRYDQKKMRAPKLVAKGQHLWAKLIVRIARKHNVPVVENKAVTRMMYHQVEIGQEIPPELYRAVAEILAALYKLRARRGGRT